MDYQQAESYILSLTDLEKIPLRSPAYFDLRRMEELLSYLESPHRGSLAIHIAGTKGKGSTAALIASALSASGYRTGLYTSPHLFSLRERIQVDGQPIPPQELVRLVERLRPVLEGYSSSYGFRTTFEVLTALAFLYFREQRVDFQVLEVGLGGRLDATNVVVPLVTVITSISFDHTEVLGHSLAEIAREKTGIIKPGRVVVSSPQFPEAAQVIREVCRKRQARLIQVGEDITWEGIETSRRGQTLVVRGLKGDYALFIPLLGRHQLENAATALAALEQVNSPQITPESIAQGFSRVSWAGRLQVLGERPWLVVDGAHNAYSAHRLREAITENFGFHNLFLIMGSSLDKDIAGMVAELALLAPSEVILAASHHPRAVPPSLLAEVWQRAGFSPMVSETIPQALHLARSQAREGDLILATGSLFVAAEVLEAIQGPRVYGAYRA